MTAAAGSESGEVPVLVCEGAADPLSGALAFAALVATPVVPVAAALATSSLRRDLDTSLPGLGRAILLAQLVLGPCLIGLVALLFIRRADRARGRIRFFRDRVTHADPFDGPGIAVRELASFDDHDPSHVKLASRAERTAGAPSGLDVPTPDEATRTAVLGWLAERHVPRAGE